jgi:hypothetical protein
MHDHTKSYSTNKPHVIFITLTLSFLISILLVGCTSGTWSLFGENSSIPKPRDPLRSAGELLDGGGSMLSAAGSSGMLEPITWVSSLFLLAAIPAFFLLSKRSFVTLLFVGVGLAVLPVVMLAVMEYLVLPVAIGAGVLGLGGVLFFLGRLWDRYVMKRKCRQSAAIIMSEDHPKRMSDVEVAELLLSVTDNKKTSKESEYE